MGRQPYREWTKKRIALEATAVPTSPVVTTAAIIAGSSIPSGYVAVIDDVFVSLRMPTASTANPVLVHIREGAAHPSGVLISSLSLSAQDRNGNVRDIRHVCSRVTSGHPDINLVVTGFVAVGESIDVILYWHLERTQ